MKIRIAVCILSASAIFGCSGGQSNPSFSNMSCTVTKHNNVSTITCPDGTSTTVSDGYNGLPGFDLVATAVPATIDQCPYGGTVILVAQDNARLGYWMSADNQEAAAVSCNGAPGQKGDTGPQGPAGTNATPVQIVNFCPGTTTYPSVFVEVGVCINNNIYAVYSANDGFLTLIAPGAWTSQAIGSSCNFTVGTNCTVSH